MHTDTTQPLMPQLRRALDKAEPFTLTYHEVADGAAQLIALVDHINALAAQCDAAGLNITSEHVRIVALNSKVQREATRILKRLPVEMDTSPSPLYATLRTIGATTQRRRRNRIITLVGVFGVIIATLWYAVATTPATADTTAILNAVIADDYALAYTLAQKEAKSFPDDLESHIWVSVLAESNGDAQIAAQAWQRALTIDGDNHAALYMRGNNRVLTKQFARANADAATLLANDVTRPEGLFLQAGIAEAQGDVTQAIALMRQAADAAEAANRSEFAVIIRIRMGGLMQYGLPKKP